MSVLLLIFNAISTCPVPWISILRLGVSALVVVVCAAPSPTVSCTLTSFAVSPSVVFVVSEPCKLFGTKSFTFTYIVAVCGFL